MDIQKIINDKKEVQKAKIRERQPHIQRTDELNVELIKLQGAIEQLEELAKETKK